MPKPVTTKSFAFKISKKLGEEMTKPVTTQGEWLDGYHQALEDAATHIESGIKVKINEPGFKYGKAYAKAIREMKDKGL